MDRLIRESAEVLQAKQLEAIKEIVSHTFGKAQTYTNLIMVAGYAAFFSMWSSVKPDLSPLPMLIAGLSMTVSATLFVVFEVHKMAATAGHLKKVQERLQESSQLNAVEEIKKAEIEFTQGQSKWWAWYFYPSLISGLLAASLLVGGFVLRIIAELGK